MGKGEEVVQSRGWASVSDTKGWEHGQRTLAAGTLEKLTDVAKSECNGWTYVFFQPL